MKKKRLDLKMLQKEVAAKLQTTVCTYRSWEKGWSSPSLPFIPRIIQFLGYIPFETEFENLGKKMRAYRQFMGLRQRDLARLLGVDPSTIYHWEKGKHKPEERRLKEVDAFFTVERAPNNGPAVVIAPKNTIIYERWYLGEEIQEGNTCI